MTKCKTGVKVALAALAALMAVALSGCNADFYVSHLYFSPPEGFEAYESGDEDLYIYVAPGYPDDDGSVITYSTDDKDPDFSTATAEDYAAAMEKQLSGVLEGEAPPEVSTFVKTKVNGYEAIRAEMTYEVDGQLFRQLKFMVDVDRTYVFALTDATEEGSWREPFAEAVGQIIFETEKL